jgi:hypothetical protein
MMFFAGFLEGNGKGISDQRSFAEMGIVVVPCVCSWFCVFVEVIRQDSKDWGVLKMFWEFGFCRFCWCWSFLLLILCCQEMGHMLLSIWELSGVFCW